MRVNALMALHRIREMLSGKHRRSRDALLLSCPAIAGADKHAHSRGAFTFTSPWRGKVASESEREGVKATAPLRLA